MSITVICIVAVVTGLSLIDISPSLLPQERELIELNYEKTKIIERTPAVMAALKSPVSGTADYERDFPSMGLAELASPGGEKSEGRRITMVLIKDRTKIAILDGVVVKEGDTFKSGIVKKIQKDGILIKDDEGERWLTIQ